MNEQAIVRRVRLVADGGHHRSTVMVGARELQVEPAPATSMARFTWPPAYAEGQPVPTELVSGGPCPCA